MAQGNKEAADTLKFQVYGLKLETNALSNALSETEKQ
jgi:hypothetical protein